MKLWFWRRTRCIHRVANSNEGQLSSCFKTKIFLCHYSSKEYLTWPQSVRRVLLLRYAKNTIRNRQYVRTWFFIIVWNFVLLCHILLYNWFLWHEIKEKWNAYTNILSSTHITIEVIQEWNLMLNCYWKTGGSSHLLETLLQFACWMMLRTDSRQATSSFSVNSWFEF